MKKTITFLFSCMLIAGAVSAQTPAGKTSIIDKTGIELKLFNARQAFNSGDVMGALKLYKEAYIAKPQDPSIAYHIGECDLSIGDIDQAVTMLEKAETGDPNANDELHLTLGQAYQQADQIDKALKEFQMYKQKYVDDPKKLKNADIEYYIAQCNTANDMQNHPVKVIVTNMGDAVNTVYDDKAPSVTADGRTLIFTSRRPLMMTPSKKGKSDDGDEVQQSFDNVYMAEWDSTKNNWGLSYPVEGINEPYAYTACSSISADGSLIFLYKNNETDAVGGDVFVSRKTHSGGWGKPATLGKPINTSYYEDCGCLSPDGNTLYFISEKPGGLGGADIYKADKIGKAEWADPVNLGATVNTQYDEGGLSIAPDGKTMFFSSEGHNSMGGYDIFKTSMNDSGTWSKPMNLGYPINTVNNDMSFTLSTDTKTGYFASNRKGGQGGRDIYKVDLSNYPLLGTDTGKMKSTGLSILRGKVMAAKNKAIESAKVTITDSTGTKTVLQTNGEGSYFITLKGGSTYKIKAESKGYKSSSMTIHLPTSMVGTYTMQQDFTLEKN
ncbi:MAG TPA: tetratricopeptide repeat protein [Bacteroidia bacterium]|nr:tetratricopeptide repeat protein [Bacteroidia bacterium]